MLYLGRYSDSTYDVQDTPKLTVPIASALGKTRDDTSDLIARHADRYRREYRRGLSLLSTFLDGEY
jgi:hypothetical protein